MASALSIFRVSSSRRFAAANAFSIGKTGSHAFVVSGVKRLQPTVASKASRSIRSTFFRSITSWALISSNDLFSVMALRSSRQSWMSEALFEALIVSFEVLLAAADRFASASLILVAEKPIVFINDRPSITGQTIHAVPANQR